MFWGDARLRKELPFLISEFNEKHLDRASYRLSIGPEIYISPTGTPEDPRNKPKTQLTPSEGFTIPSGQFGFILTEERVKVPKRAIAFISIRANYKFRGLVNVSGFHVDPNYEGRLVFSVYNAGPRTVHLSRGEPCFLIWYADLDDPTDQSKKTGFDSIPSNAIEHVADGLHSFAGLSAQIDENDRQLSERVNRVEREQAVMKWAAAVAVGALITLGLRECSLSRDGEPPTTVMTTPSAQTTKKNAP